MKKRLLPLVLLLTILCGAFGKGVAAQKLIGARFPALSPDGKQVAFSYLGDLWVASVDGGFARRITDHQAYDRQPIWSPDGKTIAFTSDRFGNNDVFLIPAEGGDPVRLTVHSASDVATDFTPDGKWVIFQSSRSSMSSLFKVRVTGGTPQPLLDTYWSWPFDGKVDASGNKLLFSLGMENRYWWRRGYRGANSTKLWVCDLRSGEVSFLFGDEANAFWPAWSADGSTVYFVSDRETGTKNIWKLTAGGEPEAVTSFREWDVTFLSLARHVPLAVYERNFGLWLTDLTTGKSREIELKVPAELKSHDFFYVDDGRVSEYQLSPDGKKIAAVVRGEIFVLSTDGGYARNITNSPWRERQVIWDSDSKHLIYVSDRDANPELYRISALGDEEPKRLTHSPEDELKPALSPDGKWVAYYHGKRELRLMRPDGKDNRLLFTADFGGWRAAPIRWSPDSRYLAVEIFRNANQDIVAVEVATGKTIDLANTGYDERLPAWSPNGKFVLFSSNRFGHSFPEFTGKWDLYQLLLEPETPEFDEERFESLFKERPTKEKKKKSEEVKVQLKLEDLDLQTKRIANTTGDETEFLLSNKDTSTVYFVSDMDGKRHLWKASLERKKFGQYEPFMAQIVNPGDLQQDKKGDYLYYLRNGRIGRIKLSSKKNETISFTTKIKVEKSADYEQMLAELYYTLQYYYYDEAHHQVNWRRVYETFRPVLQQVREDVDFYDYANQMIGFLNSSHTGIRGPDGNRTENPTGHLGLLWEKAGSDFVVKNILSNGPLYLHRDSVRVGDLLWAIDGKRVTPEENIWKLLNGKLNKRVKVTFKQKDSGNLVDVAVKPISGGAENRLLLEEWIRQNREKVRRQTNDQIAYIYMRAMGMGDLERFLKELERDAVPRKGLILDLRYNFGGNVHDRVLQALTKPVYAKWQRRGLTRTQQSTFGFADKPVVLLINEVTLSDGEMTANGFKTLKRGPIVGNTTYGWLIFTTSIQLMNGGSFRLPFWGCYTLDGRDLETGGGVKPDVVVINDLRDDLAGRDPQLEKAIEVILEKIRK